MSHNQGYEGPDADPYDPRFPPDGFPADGQAIGPGPAYGYPPSGPGGPAEAYGAPAAGAPGPVPGYAPGTDSHGFPPAAGHGPAAQGGRHASGFPADGYGPGADGYGFPPDAGHGPAAQSGAHANGYPAEGYGPGPAPSYAPGADGYGFPPDAGHGPAAQSGQYASGFLADGNGPGPAPSYAPGTDGYGFPPAAHQGYGTAGQGYGTAPGYAQGAAYVPEPLGGQLPSEAEPGAGYGVPAAGGAWGGHASAQDGYGAPSAAGGWGGPPAAAHPWGAQGTAPGADVHEPARTAAYTGPEAEAEPVVERTAAMPVVDMEPQAPPRRTGSPIIPPGIQPAALTAVLGLLMAGGAVVGKPGLAVLLVVLEAVTAAGWFRLNGMWPARQGIVLAFLAGVTADVAVLAVSGSHGPVALLGTLGVWLLFVLVLQLRHHGSAEERLSSLTATSASTLLTVVAAGYLATATSHAGTDPVVVGAVAVAAATLVRAVRLPGGEPVSIALSLAVAAATGALTGAGTDFGTGHGVLLAAAAGGCALVGLRVASYDWPSRFVHFTAGVALPLTAAAPVVYALGVALT